MVRCFGYSNVVCIVNHCAANICVSLSILQVSVGIIFEKSMFMGEKTMFLFIQKLCVFISAMLWSKTRNLGWKVERRVDGRFVKIKRTA